MAGFAGRAGSTASGPLAPAPGEDLMGGLSTSLSTLGDECGPRSSVCSWMGADRCAQRAQGPRPVRSAEGPGERCAEQGHCREAPPVREVRSIGAVGPRCCAEQGQCRRVGSVSRSRSIGSSPRPRPRWPALALGPLGGPGEGCERASSRGVRRCLPGGPVEHLGSGSGDGRTARLADGLVGARARLSPLALGTPPGVGRAAVDKGLGRSPRRVAQRPGLPALPGTRSRRERSERRRSVSDPLMPFSFSPWPGALRSVSGECPVG